MYCDSWRNAGFCRNCGPNRLAMAATWEQGAGGQGAGPIAAADIVTFPTENSHPKPVGNLGKQNVKLRCH